MIDGWFQDEFAKTIWENKYKGDSTNIGHFFARLAQLISKGDADLQRDFFRLMWTKKFAPGGRILAYAGRPTSKLSLMNCTTHTVDDDSLEGIARATYIIMRASSRGQGIGIDISKLRPAGSPVNNAAKTSTGAISFMELFNQVGYTIGQEGRRAAILFSLDITHPDIYRPLVSDIACPKCKGVGCSYCDKGYIPYDFLNVKKISGKVENANISVKISDKFMNAVKNDLGWTFKFVGETNNEKFHVETETTAQRVFNRLVKSAWESAEPGVLYWDTAKRTSNSDLFGEQWRVTGTNACLSPDTLVTTKAGLISIKTLAEMPIDAVPQILTMSRHNRLVWDNCEWVRKTRENAEVLKIKFDNNRELILTPDHKVYTKDGIWLDAKLLEVDDKVGIDIRTKVVSTETLPEKIDTYDLKMMSNHNFFANDILVHNCSEEILDQDGVCLLGSINLSKYVVNPFTKSSYFNYEEFAKDIDTSVRFLDNVIDIELEQHRYISTIQKDSLINIRRIGLGVMGLADALAQMLLPYSIIKETSMFLNNIFEFMMTCAYAASIKLAIEKGPAGAWNTLEDERSSIVNKGFFDKLPQEIKDQIVRYGTRNITVLSIAPTGSISNLYGTSSGIEPIFAHEYTRRTRVTGSDVFVDYVHPGVVAARSAGVGDIAYQTAYNISPLDHVGVQAIVQQYVDASISKTINLPSSSSVNDVADVYMSGWEQGLKGMSIYRDGSRDVQILYNDKSNNENADGCPECGTPLIHESGCKKCDSCGYAVCSI